MIRSDPKPNRRVIESKGPPRLLSLFRPHPMCSHDRTPPPHALPPHVGAGWSGCVFGNQQRTVRHACACSHPKWERERVAVERAVVRPDEPWFSGSAWCGVSVPLCVLAPPVRRERKKRDNATVVRQAGLQSLVSGFDCRSRARVYVWKTIVVV